MAGVLRVYGSEYGGFAFGLEPPIGGVHCGIVRRPGAARVLIQGARERGYDVVLGDVPEGSFGKPLPVGRYGT